MDSNGSHGPNVSNGAKSPKGREGKNEHNEPKEPKSPKGPMGPKSPMGPGPSAPPSVFLFKTEGEVTPKRQKPVTNKNIPPGDKNMNSDINLRAPWAQLARWAQ